LISHSDNIVPMNKHESRKEQGIGVAKSRSQELQEFRSWRMGALAPLR